MIKQLARNKVDKVVNMPITELIINNSELLISVVIHSNHLITGAVI